VICDDYRAWISLAADGRLDRPRQDELSSHLAACPDCRAFEVQLNRGRSLLRGLPAVQDGAFTRSVLQAASKRRPRLVFAAAALLLIGIVAYVVAPRGAPRPPEDTSKRDRLWMLLAQVARDPGTDVRQEMKDARVDSIEPWLNRPAEIESSGVLGKWRPAGLPPPGPFAESADPFRRARNLLYAGRADEAAAAFRACLDSPEEADRHDDALHWIAFIEARRGRKAEALGAYLSLSMLESPWFDAAARREAQRLALDAKASSLRLWVESSWEPVEITPGAAWCALEAAGGNKGGQGAPVAIEWKGMMLRAASAAAFVAQYPDEAAELKRRFPEILSFLEEGMIEFELDDPRPPHGP
jgi:anti-sigma factor RsiW